MRYAPAMCLLLCGLFSAGPLFAEDAWQPEKTWVFAVGVLKYEDPKLGTWPDTARVDSVLISELKRRGVPRERVAFLKNEQATIANCTKGLEQMLARTAPGDTLLFYFAGHGSRDYNDEKRPVSLMCYDSRGKDAAKYWGVKQLLDSIDKGFKGANVILTADCCHSGAIADEAATRSKFKYGVLTSAHASSKSTGNWTFTQALVDMVKGSPLLDEDADGKVTFKEVVAYNEIEMAFAEEQLSCHAAVGFSLETVMSQATGKRTGKVGERIEGLSEGDWYRCKVMEEKDGKCFVTWVGWGPEWDCWVNAQEMRPYNPPIIAEGSEVQIEFEGEWYKGKVIKVQHGLHRVHYEGFTDNDDEWVPRKRLKKAKGK